MSFRAAMLDQYSYVSNVIIVDDINVLPGLIPDMEGVSAIGDYWNGSNFINPRDAAFPPHP